MKKYKVLITSGPVHSHIDAVKIITNDFKGGRIAELANDLIRASSISWHCFPELKITYLTSKQGITPSHIGTDEFNGKNHSVIFHNGYDDYRKKVLELAPKQDAVILGAAVSNLIPVKPWKGKFPSHNYKEGEVINIPFMIAPRVINEVKKIAPKTRLIGFKLLKGVPHEELIKAAYEIVLDSKAVCVVANDRDDLDTKYVVTKERGEQKIDDKVDFVDFIYGLITDEYYRTIVDEFNVVDSLHVRRAEMIEARVVDKYKSVEHGHVFGTVAVRVPLLGQNAFITTVRDKGNSNDHWTYVHGVRGKVVRAGPFKPTLNSPLLHTIFKVNPNVEAIIHYHKEGLNQVSLPYAPPGTVRDANRVINHNFEIKGHGTFELLREGDL